MEKVIILWCRDDMHINVQISFQSQHNSYRGIPEEKNINFYLQPADELFPRRPHYTQVKESEYKFEKSKNSFNI